MNVGVGDGAHGCVHLKQEDYYQCNELKDGWHGTVINVREYFWSGVTYFLPRGPHKSQFWLHSGTWQCCPHVTVKLELLAWHDNVKHLMPWGSILDEKGLHKIGKE